MDIRAITLDLDNTLWDVWPVIDRAERSNYSLLEKQYPQISAHYSVEDLRDIRQELFDSRPDIRFDFSELRRLVFVQILEEFGCDTSAADMFVQDFLHHRNLISLYPDVLPALKALSDQFPLVSLSDGNSDLNQVGIGDYFVGSIYAAEVGALKPAPVGFLKACEIAGYAPEETLHIGDHPTYDMDGARRVGMKTMWMRRHGEPWEESFKPDFTVTSMADAVEVLQLDPD